MTEFTEPERKVLGTAIAMARAGVGFTINADRVADRITADKLVASGHLTAVEDVEGGYALPREVATAMLIDAAAQAEAAKSN